MTKQKIRFLLPVLLAACALLFAGIFVGSVAQAETVWSEVSFQEQYYAGTDLTIPARTVTVNGQTLNASSVLTFPDGSARRVSGRVTLEETGDYTLTYSAAASGASYADKIPFKVISRAFNVSSDYSSVEYTDVSVEFFANGGNVQFDREGLLVNLAQGDVFTSEQLIDVSQLTKNDVLIGLSVIPHTMGEADFTRLEFTLTDALDESVCLRISVTNTTFEDGGGINKNATYILAGGQNQPRSGFESGKDILHVENEWGSGIIHSFYGDYREPNGAVFNDPNTRQTMKLRYDASEIALYGTNTSFVADFDDPTYFTNLWHGFPSGRAKLSIRASQYIGSSAQFLISEIYGTDLTMSDYEDTEPPMIEIDNEYEEMPDAKVGGTYPVPAASAIDYGSGETDVSVQVFYNYDTDSAFNVPVVNGRFETARPGIYAIVYTAKDGNGKEAKEVLVVEAKADVSAPEIVVDDSAKTCLTGELVTLPEVQVSGGSGETSLSVTAECGDTLIDCEGGSFRPEIAGEWTVTYIAQDYIGQMSERSFTLTVQSNPTPVFIDKPNLPAAFVSGSQYVMPELYANDYSSGKSVRVEATAYVFDAQHPEGYAVKSGETFSPVAANNGDKVTVRYTAGSASVSYEVTAILPFENSRLQLANYIIADGVEREATAADGIAVTAVDSEGSWTFANALLIRNTNIQFRTSIENSDYSALKVTLTDAADASNAIEAYLYNNGGSTRFVVGSQSVVVNSGFTNSATQNNITLRYADGYFALEGASLQVLTRTDGLPFEGFAEDKVFLTVSFVGAQPGSVYNLLRIGDQLMNVTGMDRIAPSVEIYGDYGGSFAQDTVVTLPVVRAGDVLDPNVVFTLTVTGPDGEPVQDVNGVTLDGVDPGREWRIRLSEIGSYRVRYTAADTFNDNETPFAYQLIAENHTPPVLSFDGEWASEAKVGERYILPEISVQATGDYTLFISVTTPSGLNTVLLDTETDLIFNSAGKYKIALMVIDENGNTSSHIVDVTVV